MNYIVGLKNEVELLNDREARQRYLELLAMGYSESDIVFAAPVAVQAQLNIGKIEQDAKQPGFSETLNPVAQVNDALPSQTPS